MSFFRNKSKGRSGGFEPGITPRSLAWMALCILLAAMYTNLSCTYLYEQIGREDCPDGIAIPRKNYFMGRFMHCHYPDYLLRFFKRDAVSWPPYVHAVPQIAGTTKRLPAAQKELAFEHLANDSVSDILRKTDQYTDYELLKKQGKHYGPLAYLWRPFFRWFKAYILKGGIRDGLPGFIKACLEGYYQFIMLAKMVEQRNHT